MMNQSFNLEKINTIELMRTLNALIRIYLLTGTKSCSFFISKHVYHINGDCNLHDESSH